MLESLKGNGCEDTQCLDKVREVFSAPVRLFTDCSNHIEPSVFMSDEEYDYSDIDFTFATDS